MRSQIGKWGSSSAVRLPKMAVETLGLRPGDPVSMAIEDGALVIRRDRPFYKLEDLVRQAKGHNPPDSLDDGPVGDETL